VHLHHRSTLIVLCSARREGRKALRPYCGCGNLLARKSPGFLIGVQQPFVDIIKVGEDFQEGFFLVGFYDKFSVFLSDDN